MRPPVRSCVCLDASHPGARISFVFHEIFANGIRELDPFDQVTDADIRTILYNASVRPNSPEASPPSQRQAVPV